MPESYRRGVTNYESARGTLPAGMEIHAPLENFAGFSTANSTWAIEVLEDAEESVVADRFEFERPISDFANLHLIDDELPVFKCPTDTGPDGYSNTNIDGPGQTTDASGVLPARSSYVGISGQELDTVYWSRPIHVIDGGQGAVPTADSSNLQNNAKWDRFRRKRGPLTRVAESVRQLSRIELRQVIDGTTKTDVIAEHHTTTLAGGIRPPCWGDWRAYFSMSDGAYSDERFDPPRIDARNRNAYIFGLADFQACVDTPGAAPVACERAAASLHAGDIIQVALLDGSVRAVSVDTDPEVWGAAVTIAGEENVRGFE